MNYVYTLYGDWTRINKQGEFNLRDRLLSWTSICSTILEFFTVSEQPTPRRGGEVYNSVLFQLLKPEQ